VEGQNGRGYVRRPGFLKNCKAKQEKDSICSLMNKTALSHFLWVSLFLLAFILSFSPPFIIDSINVKRSFPIIKRSKSITQLIN
jgi:hypothetical protein